MVKDHLQRCSACRYEIESLRRTAGLLNYYVEPEPPEGYHDQFWRELQVTIEQTELQPIWWAGIGVWRGACRSGHSLLDRLAYSYHTLIGTASQLLFRTGRLVPIYSFIFIIMSALFVANHLMQSPEENRRPGARQLRSALDEYPVRFVHEQGNRELVTKRDKVLGLSQGLANQEHHAPKKVNHELELAELHSQGWDSYDQTTLYGTTDTLRTNTDETDVFPYLIASAQLSNPDSALTTREFSGVVAINSPFPEKFEREGRQLNSSLQVLKNVAVRDLSLTEVYDAVKL